jgi:PDGLE domain
VDRRNLALFVVGGLIVVLGLAFFVSPYASGSPDGLNRVAIDKGFADTQKGSVTAGSPLAGYGVKGIENQHVSKGLSGVIGVAITFGVGMILFGLLRSIRARRRPTGSADTAAAP